MHIDLSGRTAIVSGSTAGIGYAIALGLAGCGASVIVNGRSEPAVAAAEAPAAQKKPSLLTELGYFVTESSEHNAEYCPWFIPHGEESIARFDVPISIDTSKPEVMRAGVAAGAGLVNDVNALRAEGALDAVAELKVSVCLMHMQGEPETMQQRPHYASVVEEVKDFFGQRIDACLAAGIDRDRLLLDPGFGFGKTLAHNIELLARLPDFEVFALPLLVGMSRKSMLGAILGGAPVDQRLFAGVGAATIAALRGAHIIRTHDVRATREALAVAIAVLLLHHVPLPPTVAVSTV